MEDLGYSACASTEAITEVLNQSGTLSNASVAYVLAMMARTNSGLPESTLPAVFFSCGTEDSFRAPQEVAEGRPAPVTWDVAVFVDAVKSLAPSIEWPAVMRLLDVPSFKVTDHAGLNLILSAFKHACAEPFPTKAFLGRWKNAAGQLSLLRLCLSAPVDMQQQLFSTRERWLGSADEDFSVWNSVDLVETLVHLADMVGYGPVAALFEEPKQTRPEQLLVALAQSMPSWGPLYSDLVCALITRACVSSAPAQRVSLFRQVWSANKNAVILGLICMYQKDGGAGTLRYVLDVLNELNILLDVLSTGVDYHFVLDIAVAAAQTQAFPLANWMSKKAQEGQDKFAQGCVSFLRTRVYCMILSGAQRSARVHVPPECASTILHALQGGKFSAAAMKDVSKLVQDTQGRLLGGAPTPTQPGAGANGQPGLPNAGAGATGGAAAPMGGGAGAVGEGGVTQQQQPQQAQQAALFAADIEEEANSHFQRIYTSEMQIEGVIQMLKGFKSSPSQREQEVFACMIHNLFDEYRFFPRYPERELLITGKLFGSLIQHQLVSSITLGIALRYVLEALRKPLNSNMFKFGMCALEQFKQRLVEWPQYCHHILQISHVRQSHEELINYIQNALSSGRKDAATPTNTPPQQPAAGVSPPQAQPSLLSQQAQKPFGELGQAPAPAAPAATQSPAQQAYGAFNGQQAPTSNAGFNAGFGQNPQHQLPTNLQNFAADSGGSGSGGAAQEPAATVDMRSATVQQTLSVVSGASAFSATNVDLLLQRAKQVQQPDVSVQDKVHFIFNNLSTTNLDQKEKDLTAACGEVYVPWLSQYIVIKRAAQEANYHALYLQFVDRLDKKISQLLKTIVSITLENVKILLVDDKITTSSSLRSLLKNLGSWLGALTLQKNKPILQKDLDFKQLLLEAYDKGRLIAVVPFVAKVLESCTNSRIFRPPNPWTMLILSLFAELHPLNDLKLNIKFEIEVLCKNLNKDIKDIKPTSVFKNRPVTKEGNTDWTSRDSAAVAGVMNKPLTSAPDARLLAAAAGVAGAPPATVGKVSLCIFIVFFFETCRMREMHAPRQPVERGFV
jgi:CCR4-NOT transcription complex subunit 1